LSFFLVEATRLRDGKRLPHRRVAVLLRRENVLRPVPIAMWRQRPAQVPAGGRADPGEWPEPVGIPCVLPETFSRRNSVDQALDGLGPNRERETEAYRGTARRARWKIY